MTIRIAMVVQLSHGRSGSMATGRSNPQASDPTANSDPHLL